MAPIAYLKGATNIDGRGKPSGDCLANPLVNSAPTRLPVYIARLQKWPVHDQAQAGFCHTRSV